MTKNIFAAYGIVILVVSCCFAFFTTNVAVAGFSKEKEHQVDATLVHVETIGRCAIENFTPRQAQRVALRQARALAVEKAAGVKITAATLVTNGSLVGDFIKSFSSGYIVDEDVTWLPATQYQKDASRPPIFEYSLKLSATVKIIPSKRTFMGLTATLNQKNFRANKEKMEITVSTRKACRIAIFNIMANDTVAMLYPCDECPCMLAAHQKNIFPAENTDELLVAPLPGNSSDTEAILVAALPADISVGWGDVFLPDEQLPLSEFFARYSMVIADGAEVILPYEVFE